MDIKHSLIKTTLVGSSVMQIQFTGVWQLGAKLPKEQELISYLSAHPEVKTIGFEAKDLTAWDSVLLVFISKLISNCEIKGIVADYSGLPYGVRRLLSLASAVPEKKGAKKEKKRPSFFVSVADDTINFLNSSVEILSFLGEAFLALTKFFAGKARYRSADLWTTIQECGVNALPIVSMISLLVGLILAFVGAIQLKMFGAEIYVADLVGIAMIRVMGAVMTGIIMAGRTGAAFAAQIGTMEVNEEIDALKTLGIDPVEFLVLPRMLGLTIMMPLLCLYADLMGFLGGLIVGVSMLDLNIVQYFLETRNAVGLSDLWIGLFQGTLFGILVALTGCLRGMQCGRSAAAVGEATTSAVVTGIVSIVVTTALVTVICNVLGI